MVKFPPYGGIFYFTIMAIISLLLLVGFLDNFSNGLEVPTAHIKRYAKRV